jgi:hypothetical protein
MRKSFKTFKVADSWFQAILLVSSIAMALYLTFPKFKFNEELFFIYFLIGSAQLLSFIINLIWVGVSQSHMRKYYAWTLLAFLLLLIPPFTVIGLFALLFVSPILAIWYAYINFSELKELSFFY